MTPVAPGWVAIPHHQTKPNEWYHIVGWTNSQPTEPIIAVHNGVTRWGNEFGEDPYVISTYQEWVKGE
jgi:hypothetical protein